MSETTLCKKPDTGSICTRMAGHDGDCIIYPDTAVMTDSQKLDAILASQLRAEQTIKQVAEMVIPLLDYVKPTIDALEKSPLGKMIIGKVNR